MVVLKPNLQDKEKKVLMIVIPLQVVANIAQVTNKFGIKFFYYLFIFIVGASSGPEKKTQYPKRAGSGPWVLPRGSGPDMKKPGPNPTRCHPY